MDAPNAFRYYGRLHANSPRAEGWRQVLGSLNLPLMSDRPGVAYLPGSPELRVVYFVALDELTEVQRERLVENLAQRFGYPTAYVDAKLGQVGCPVLADEMTVRRVPLC